MFKRASWRQLEYSSCVWLQPREHHFNNNRWRNRRSSAIPILDVRPDLFTWHLASTAEPSNQLQTYRHFAHWGGTCVSGVFRPETVHIPFVGRSAANVDRCSSIMASSSHLSIGTRGQAPLTTIAFRSSDKGRSGRKRKLESISFGADVRPKRLSSLSYLNQYIKLPSQVVDCERRENTDWLSLILAPTTKSTRAVFEKCLQQNGDSYSRLFSFVDNQIFVKDMFRCGESPIHGAACCFFTSLFRRYGDSFHQLLGQDAFQYQCHRSQTHVGTPDAMIAVPGEGSSSYPIVMLEIGYETSLSDLHRKARNYFSAYETLQVVLVLDIGYPWETSFDSDANVEYLSQSGGKMTLYRYERGVDAPIRATSFGKVALSQRDIAVATEATGISASSIMGNVEEPLGENDYFIQYRGPPCHQRAMDEYQIRISLVSLLADINGAKSLSPLWELLTTLGLSALQADLVFDLFALQYDIHRHGVHQTNQIIAVQNGAERYTIPARPVYFDDRLSTFKSD